MKKVDELREKMGQLRGALMLLPAVARESIILLQQTIDEQQAQIDALVFAVNRLTAERGDK